MAGLVVAHKALSKIRELQRGVPPPYGEAFSMETLIPDQLAARHLRPEPRPELALIAHAVIGGAHPGCLYQTQRPLERIQSSRHGLVGHCHGLLRGRPNGCKTKLASTHARCQVFANTYAASDMVAIQTSVQRPPPCRQEARSQLACKASTEHFARGRRPSSSEDQGAASLQRLWRHSFSKWWSWHGVASDMRALGTRQFGTGLH
ncbi:hypothetical protein WJX77_003542 [Trebouxia sp. C0004]